MKFNAMFLIVSQTICFRMLTLFFNKILLNFRLYTKQAKFWFGVQFLLQRGYFLNSDAKSITISTYFERSSLTLPDPLQTVSGEAKCLQ